MCQTAAAQSQYTPPNRTRKGRGTSNVGYYQIKTFDWTWSYHIKVFSVACRADLLRGMQ